MDGNLVREDREDGNLVREDREDGNPVRAEWVRWKPS